MKQGVNLGLSDSAHRFEQETFRHGVGNSARRAALSAGFRQEDRETPQDSGKRLLWAGWVCFWKNRRGVLPEMQEPFQT